MRDGHQWETLASNLCATASRLAKNLHAVDHRLAGVLPLSCPPPRLRAADHIDLAIDHLVDLGEVFGDEFRVQHPDCLADQVFPFSYSQSAGARLDVGRHQSMWSSPITHETIWLGSSSVKPHRRISM